MHKVGVHLVDDVSRYYRYEGAPHAIVERHEFLEACERLRSAGYAVGADEEAAWKRFSELRGVYAPWINRLARVLALPPAPWIGDRSYLPHRATRRRPRTAAARP
jgi:hypothetical protein